MMSASLPILSASRLRVAFGTFLAVNDFSADFEHGRRYALIGPNGAGKTTLLNALSGRQRITSGCVQLSGEDITHLPAHRRLTAGIGRSFQIVNIFFGLTVFENLCLAVQGARYGGRQPWTRLAAGDREVQQAAQELAEQVGLQSMCNALASTLSHGDQRALELALALASNPRVLLLDEPLAGVGHGRIAETLRLIEGASHGRTVLMVEHNIEAVMNFAEEILVLEAGALLARGTPDQIRSDSKVRRAYLGD